MAAKIKKSVWRNKRWNWHGENVYKDMQNYFNKKKRFDINSVANLPSLNHLSSRYSYDLATAICRKLELEDKIVKQGRVMYLNK